MAINILEEIALALTGQTTNDDSVFAADLDNDTLIVTLVGDKGPRETYRLVLQDASSQTTSLRETKRKAGDNLVTVTFTDDSCAVVRLRNQEKALAWEITLPVYDKTTTLRDRLNHVADSYIYSDFRIGGLITVFGADNVVNIFE